MGLTHCCICPGQISRLGLFNNTLPNIPILLDTVVCRGDESSFLQCSHLGIGIHNCDNEEDIVLECTGKELYIVSLHGLGHMWL